MPSCPSPSPMSWGVVGCCVLLVSCATVDPTAEYDRVTEEIRVATGIDGVYRPDEADSAAERVGALIEGGLELHEAVELALLNNPAFRAAFRAIGMAKADRVQAGLLTNPSLAVAVRLPTSGGPVDLEGNLLGSLIDVWQIPARTDAAESALKQRVLEVAHRAVTLAGTVRAAYIEAVTAERLREIAEENRSTAARLLELAEERVAAMATTAIEASLARLELSSTELRLRDAQLAVMEARRDLATLLGLGAWPPETQLTSTLPNEDPALPTSERLNELALTHRLDVRAAREAVEEASAELDRQRGLLARRLGVGMAAERGEGSWAVGPSLQLELPLFDQNQAQIAKASAHLAQREGVLSAVRLTARDEVETALSRVVASWDVVGLYAEQILPESQDALDIGRDAYQLGRTTIVPVLEAQRRLLEARHRYIERLRQAAVAQSELERATGIPRATWIQSDSEEPQ